MEKRQGHAYFIVWALFIFLFFSVSSTQLFSYILPMFPPLAILSSAYLARIEETGHISKAFIICHVVFALITTGAVAFVPFSSEGAPIVHYAIAGLMVLAAFLLGKPPRKRKVPCLLHYAGCFDSRLRPFR